MKETSILKFFLIVAVFSLNACAPSPRTVEVTRLVPQTAEVTRLVRQTVVVTQPVPQNTSAAAGPTPTGAPQPLATRDPKAMGVDLAAVLRLFPLYPGTRWLYTRVAYTQTGDPNQVISAATSIEERVMEVQNQPPYFVAHIQRVTALIREDPDWETGGFALNLGQSEFWYLVANGRVYLTSSRPDLANLRMDQMLEELDMPLARGLSWCPNKEQKESLTPEAETPIPCQFAGARQVLASGPFQTQAGSFDSCFQLGDFYNSGGPLQWFCDGIGFVTSDYRHAGTVFGSSQWLIEFSPGKPQFVDIRLTPQPATPTPLAGAVPSPRWMIYQQALAVALIGPDTVPSHRPEEGLCEWEIYGQAQDKVYLWALCQDAGSSQGTAASAPAIITLDGNGNIQKVESPRAALGNFISLFPPELRPHVQQGTPGFTFDPQAALAHIDRRRANLDIPPLIVLAGQSLP